MQIYEEQAGGTERAREEADQTWPTIVAAHRLAFRILAECWEIEAEGDAGKARGPLLFGAGGEYPTVRALDSLQVGQAAENPRSASVSSYPKSPR